MLSSQTANTFVSQGMLATHFSFVVDNLTAPNHEKIRDDIKMNAKSTKSYLHPKLFNILA